MIDDAVAMTQDRRKLFGYEVVTAEGGEVEARWRPPMEIANPLKQAHGGMIAGLVDDMCGLALVTVMEDATKGLPTISLHVDYYRPAWIGTEYTVRARVLKHGRRVAFCEMTAEDADGKILLRGTCSFAMG